MKHLIFCLSLIVSALASSACASLVGKLPPPKFTQDWQHWNKDEVGPGETKNAYLACKAKQGDGPLGFESGNNADECMLNQGFAYVDDPVRPFCNHSRWRSEEEKMKWVVCRSLVKPVSSK
jgi:hypothetical protein